jgi:hypothetical protein
VTGETFPGARVRGPWSDAEVASFLRAAVIPLRLAATTPTGWPLVLSLWFFLDGAELVCATQRDAGIVRALEGDPRCAFEIAGERPPYRGVRGRGPVRLETDGAREALDALIERYLGTTDSSLAEWLRSRADTEVRLRITPVELSSWDYTRRMSGA